MKLLRQSVRGLTVYRDPVTVDFDAMGPGLLAVVGRNGSGKTSFLDAAMASLDKALPTRPGSLYDHCSGRDAYIETVWEDAGHEIKVRLQIDAERRTCEQYLFLDGVSLTTGRAAEFGNEVERRFGSRELRLASIYAAQDKSGNFLTMKKGSRKDLFVELLGLGTLQVLAESARERGGDADYKLTAARAILTGAAEDASGVDRAEADLTAAQAAADAAAKALDTARSEEAAAIAAHERAKSAGERIAALQNAERAARAAYVEAEKANVVAGRGVDAAAARRSERLRAIDARKADELEPAARRRHADGITGIDRRRAALEAQLRDVPDADESREMCEVLESHKLDATLAIEKARAAGTATGLAKIRLEAAARALAEARARVASDRERLSRQAERLGQVPCTGPVPDIAAACPLLADARLAAGRLAGLEEPDDSVWIAAESAYVDARSAMEALGSDFIDPASYDPAIKHALDAIAKAEAAGHAREALAALAGERATLDTTLFDDVLAAGSAVNVATSDRELVNEQYEAELIEADSTLQAAREAQDRAQEAFDAAAAALSEGKRDAGDASKAQFALTVAEATRNVAEKGLRAADEARATAQARVEQLRQKAARLPELQAAVQLAEEEVGDWALLTKSLGRDGVQALEIDAAGPEVATLTNELLAACYGPRFSITFETLATKRDGGQKEVFDVRVYDGPAERPVEALSGGEKVVVGEAIGLAIAIFNARKSGVTWRTLFRDETAGALDTTNAGAYVQMLRRARELGGFHQVLFVAHQPEIFEAADARLIVAGGAIVAETSRAAA